MTQEPQEVGAEIIHVFPQPDASDTWQLVRERGCVTIREVADAYGISRGAARERLRRLERYGRVASVIIDGTVKWCLAEGAPSVAAPRRRPRGPSRTTLARIEAVYAVIEREGCATSALLRRELGLSHTQVRYAARTLLAQSRAAQRVVGAVALWCRDSAAAQEHVERLRDAVRRLIKDGVKYVTPAKVLEWINQDKEARRLFSRYISLKRYNSGFPAASIAFVSDILTSLYGEPVPYRKHNVYFVAHGGTDGLKTLPDHVARCCAALKAHIEQRLASAKGGVVSVSRISRRVETYSSRVSNSFHSLNAITRISRRVETQRCEGH